MQVHEIKATAAYRCPVCGAGILSTPGVFSIAKTAGRITLRCSNPECSASGAESGASTLFMDIRIISDSRGNKASVSVPCIFCGRSHIFSASVDLLEERARTGRTLIFSCPVSGIDLAFVGEENHVKAELARAELELLDAYGDDSSENINAIPESGASLPDPEITDIINFMVSELRDEGKLFCACSPAEDGSCTGNYSTEPGPGYVTVRCEKCGRKRIISATSLISAHELINLDSMTLE